MVVLLNAGKTNTDKIPSITNTITNSIMVKPPPRLRKQRDRFAGRITVVVAVVNDKHPPHHRIRQRRLLGTNVCYCVVVTSVAVAVTLLLPVTTQLLAVPAVVDNVVVATE